MLGVNALVIAAALAVAAVDAHSLPTVDLGYTVHQATANVSYPMQETFAFSFQLISWKILRELQTLSTSCLLWHPSLLLPQFNMKLALTFTVD